MRKFILHKLLWIALAVTGTVKAQDQAADLLWQGFGGRDAWNESRYFLFTHSRNTSAAGPAEQRYLWDRRNGACRLESLTADEQPLIVLFNTGSQDAQVFIDGKPVTDQTATDSIRKQSADHFRKDAYWLFIPALLEKSKQLSHQGNELIGNRRYEVFETTCQIPEAGPAVCRFFADSRTGRIERWTVRDESGGIRYDFMLSAFKDIGGGLVLATRFDDQARHIHIHYPITAALMGVEPDKFSKP
jgi:hypothetical protein